MYIRREEAEVQNIDNQNDLGDFDQGNGYQGLWETDTVYPTILT